jgi:hypothetical protein
VSTRGRSLSLNCFLHAFRRFPRGFGLFLSSVSFPGGIGLTGERHRSDRCSTRCWVILSIGRSGEGDRSDRSELSCCSCSVSFGVLLAFIQGEFHLCIGSSLWFFKLWFRGLHSLLEHSFVSDVSSRCPCLRGSRLVFFRWSSSLPFFGFRSLVGVSFYSFLFFFLFSQVTICVCVQCNHQGGDRGSCVVRGPVDGRFLVWWVIDNVLWIDSWLSIAGVGCGLTSVGAGQEQVRKVVVGEASWCREDK